MRANTDKAVRAHHTALALTPRRRSAQALPRPLLSHRASGHPGTFPNLCNLRNLWFVSSPPPFDYTPFGRSAQDGFDFGLRLRSARRSGRFRYTASGYWASGHLSQSAQSVVSSFSRVVVWSFSRCVNRLGITGRHRTGHLNISPSVPIGVHRWIKSGEAAPRPYNLCHLRNL